LPGSRVERQDAAREHRVRRTRSRSAAWALRTEAAFELEGRQAETELNFKFYRQATNKIVGISGKRQSSSASSLIWRRPIIG
jgi:hypothetical protein